MNYEVRKEFENQLAAAYETGNDSLRILVQNRIDVDKELRKCFVNELLMRGYEKYTQLLTVKQQVDIILPLIISLKHKNTLAYDEALILAYSSKRAVDEILSNADNVSLGILMKAIRDKIGFIGNRLVDLRWETTVFSRMRERKIWRKLYKKCESNLKQ